MLETSRRFSVRTSRYGSAESQEGDLYLPPGARLPIVCLLHGGFWRMPYGRDELAAVAAGDPVELVELPETGHMEFVDPRSEAHRILCEWLVRRVCSAVRPLILEGSADL